MNTSHPTGTALVLSCVFSFTLLSTSAFAQAGISGNAMEGQTAERLGRNSQFDNGTLKTKSALGQLEAISGGKVDRSSSSSRQPNNRAAPAPAPRPAKPRFDANQAFKQELAGAVAGALIGALFSDNSAQQRAAAEAEAARAAAQAAAEAEAYRVQQELARLARIQRAKTYRAEWDSRETEIGGRLDGAFDVTSAPGTAFFGRPANPDADTVAAILAQDIGSVTAAPHEPTDSFDSDPSVVDLRDSSLIVQPMGSGSVSTRMPTRSSGTLMPSWAYEMRESPRSSADRGDPGKWENLLTLLGPVLGKFDKNELIIGMLKSAVWEKAKKRLPFSNYGEAVYDANTQRIEDTEELSGINGEHMRNTFGSGIDVAGILSSRSTSDRGYIEKNSASLDYDGRKMVANIYKMTASKITGRFEESGDDETDIPAGDVVYLNGVPDPTITHWRDSAIGH